MADAHAKLRAVADEITLGNDAKGVVSPYVAGIDVAETLAAVASSSDLE